MRTLRMAMGVVLLLGVPAAAQIGDALVEITVHQDGPIVSFTFSHHGKPAPARGLLVREAQSGVSIWRIVSQGYDWPLRIEYGRVPDGFVQRIPAGRPPEPLRRGVAYRVDASAGTFLGWATFVYEGP